MRKFVLAVFAVLFTIASCKDKDKFSIEGKLENSGGIKRVLLYEMDELVDSAFLNENDEFQFTRTSTGPNFYTLLVGDKNFLLVAKNGDEIEFSTNYSDTSNTYTIDGSEESLKIKEFNQLSGKYGKVFQKIQSDYTDLVSAMPSARDSLERVFLPEFQLNMDAFIKEAFAFGQGNKDNLAGFYAVSSIDQPDNDNRLRYEKELIGYAEAIKTKFPENKAVKSFVDKMLAIKEVAVGQPAPEFELATPEGKLVKLSSLRGKYVLLDFWASWCAPCRAENPNIVAQYNAFKDKGFTIIGVSLDDNKEAWVKAIKDDRLNWTQVSDLNRWDSKVAGRYHVDGIPASFILDPEGKIVAKNLRGAELKDFLSKTLR
jgi:peroxiredoxin